MLINTPNREFIIKDTHRGLWYEDGRLADVLEAGRYKIPPTHKWFRRMPTVECVLVDIRERDLTLKGQEILTSDKVAIRVNIIVQYRVTDAKAAVHAVANYEERLYSDVQLAARRSLASMTLEDILTNRNRLSEDIHTDVKEASSSYGVAIRRADVKDLIFPGNLQEIMNRVLAAERNSEAQLVDARTRAEVEKIEAAAHADTARSQAETAAEARRLEHQAQAETSRVQAEAEARVYQERQKTAAIMEQHPALVRLAELEALRELAKNANARIHLNFGRNGMGVAGLDADERDDP